MPLFLTIFTYEVRRWFNYHRKNCKRHMCDLYNHLFHITSSQIFLCKQTETLFMHISIRTFLLTTKTCICTIKHTICHHSISHWLQKHSFTWYKIELKYIVQLSTFHSLVHIRCSKLNKWVSIDANNYENKYQKQQVGLSALSLEVKVSPAVASTSLSVQKWS